MLLEFQRDFAATIGARAEGAMRVYRNTILSGCIEALRSNYPVVARLIGDEMFEGIAAEYATQRPPRRPVLALYGARLPDWIEEQPWIEDVPYLADVARIERLHVEVLFAADERALEMEELKGREDWQELLLTLHPATRFNWLPTPSRSIWFSQRGGALGQLAFDWTAEGILFTRPMLEVEPQCLDRPSHRFLSGVRLGETVGTAALATASLYPETDIGSLFTSLVTAGAFAALSNRSLP